MTVGDPNARTTGVNPAILTWARESAGYTVEQMAAKLPWIANTFRRYPSDIRDLEAGIVKPCAGVLKKWAKITRRPVSVFYLPEVPVCDDYPDTVRDLQLELLEFAGDTDIDWRHNGAEVWRVSVEFDHASGRCVIHILTKDSEK